MRLLRIFLSIFNLLKGHKMAETAQATPIQQAPSTRIKTNSGHITGKIVAQRKLTTTMGPLHLSVLRLPSADSFSHPATVELRSDAKLGEVGDDWSGMVSLRGMPNNYDMKDKETGETRKVISARNEYQVID
jgi:hypothetical protein